MELQDLSLEQIAEIGFDPSAPSDTLPAILQNWPLRLKAAYWLRGEQSRAMEIAAWTMASGEAVPVDPITGSPFLVDPGGRELTAPVSIGAKPLVNGPTRRTIPQMRD